MLNETFDLGRDTKKKRSQPSSEEISQKYFLILLYLSVF